MGISRRADETMRTEWMDPDFRRQPKTDRYCVLCQRDLKPGQPCRGVRWELDKWEAIHPSDWDAAEVEVNRRRNLKGACAGKAVVRGLVGMDCAKRLGLEWTGPAPDSPT